MTSPLINREEAVFNKALAHHLLYGSGSSDEFNNLPSDFQFVYLERNNRGQRAIEETLVYLDFIGIKLNYKKLK